MVVDNFDLTAHINIGGTDIIDLTMEMEPIYRRQIIEPDKSIAVPIVGMYLLSTEHFHDLSRTDWA